MIQWQPLNRKPDIHIRKAALAKFLSRFPDRLDIRLNLANQHLYLGENEEAWNLLDQAQSASRTDPAWLSLHGKVAGILGNNEIAEGSLIKAWKNGSRAAGFELAKLFQNQGRYSEAIALSHAILEQDPDNHGVTMILCKSLIANDDLDVLWEWTRHQMADDKQNAALPSALAYAASSETQMDIVKKSTSAGSYISCQRNIARNTPIDRLTEILLSHKARSDFPTIYAGQGEGKRIDRLLELDIPEVDALFDRIKVIVEQYRVDANHSKNGIFKESPKKASIESWANICTEDGHEDWHCHPAGWLSGVYYVDVPDLRTADDKDKSGQIEFGPLMLGRHNDLDGWPKTSITPETDMLLLFPSYFGHRTYPTGLAAPRISIAFDIVAAADE